MHRIAIVVSPGFQAIGLAALSAFEMANVTAKKPLYEVSVLSARGGRIAASIPGLSVETKRLDKVRYDTVLITGGLEPAESPKELVEFARRSVGRARRVASICMGAFVLAEAGVLDGREVTTHWAAAAALQARFPKLKVNSDRIYIVDGAIWTSAGASAGIDLALGMVERDLGHEVARLVSRKLVLYHRRAGGQSQHSALLELDAKSDRVQLALDFAKRHLAKDLDVEQLAEAARLSPRQFSRVFRAETGQSPAKAVEALRVEAARVMMEQTRHPIEVIALQTGFGDRERMRRSFLRAFGQPPQSIRRGAHAA